MELRDLRYFLACLECGQLTQAALKLHVTQSTLSHALGRLEEELGQALFERPGKGQKGMRPTPVGQLLALRARRALSEVSGFYDDLSALAGKLSGSLRLGSLQTLNSTLLPTPLAQFARLAPEVSVSLHTYAAERIPEALAAGEIDLGLLAGAPEHVLRELAERRLRREGFVAIIKKGSRLARARSLSLKDVAGEGLVLPLAGTFTSELIERACRRAGFAPQVLLRLESGEAIREVVRAGLGMTILPQGYLARRDADLQALPLVRPRLTRDVHAVWNPRLPLSLNARTFLDLCH